MPSALATGNLGWSSSTGASYPRASLCWNRQSLPYPRTQSCISIFLSTLLSDPLCATFALLDPQSSADPTFRRLTKSSDPRGPRAASAETARSPGLEKAGVCSAGLFSFQTCRHSSQAVTAPSRAPKSAPSTIQIAIQNGNTIRMRTRPIMAPSRAPRASYPSAFLSPDRTKGERDRRHTTTFVIGQSHDRVTRA